MAHSDVRALANQELGSEVQAWVEIRLEKLCAGMSPIPSTPAGIGQPGALLGGLADSDLHCRVVR